MAFCMNCGQQIDDFASFCPYCGSSNQPTAQSVNNGQFNNGGQQPFVNNVYIQTPAVGVSDKSKVAAALLSFFLGGFGAHRFYVGKVGSGLAMLLCTFIGWILIVPFIAVGIWNFVDFITILCGSFKDINGNLLK